MLGNCSCPGHEFRWPLVRTKARNEMQRQIIRNRRICARVSFVRLFITIRNQAELTERLVGFVRLETKEECEKRRPREFPFSSLLEWRSFSRLCNARKWGRGSADNEATRRREKSRDLIKLPGELRDSITILMIIRGKPQGRG